ncbi:unnamed protein product [Symbiodinium pilosum]|uniref:Uncharacterized protein n=1 Tax=Symbiodinium pilosum TaxID=2952 RepID=A0A812MY92_SYMPI|nr:unnamed protein product [Symbiodinium pilosum]
MAVDCTPTISFSGESRSSSSFLHERPLSSAKGRADGRHVRHQAELMGITPGTSLLAQQTGHSRWISEDDGEEGLDEEVEVEVEVEEMIEEVPTEQIDASPPEFQREPFIVRRRAEIALRDLACKAICRIKKGLRKPGAQIDGKPFIPQDWDQVFKPHLGSYIRFLLSRPDQFRVLQGSGPGRYAVEDVTGSKTVVAPSPEELASKGGKGGFKGKDKGKSLDPARGGKGAYKGKAKTKTADLGKSRKGWLESNAKAPLPVKAASKNGPAPKATPKAPAGGKGQDPIAHANSSSGGKGKSGGRLGGKFSLKGGLAPVEDAGEDALPEEEEVIVPKKRGFLISSLLSTKRRFATDLDDVEQS